LAAVIVVQTVSNETGSDLMKARGLKEREIVELTGRPAGTVSSQIARLLERLRLALKGRGCL
jgi:DNA-directed RNA polymerase specialized sigma24 family protein